ncbi:MAG: recombinase family protein [Actinomycetota bacterium]|nr:recombinase family protein [Actinomycetota bacterium]
MATKLKPSPRAAAVYCRISQDGEGSRLGVKRQERDCKELAERRGWPIAAVFIDNDVSAYSGKRRPQYQAMLESIERDEIDAVVVWHLDRLTRRPVELEDFFEVCDRSGLKHMACVSGDIDLSTHDGQFHARILAAVARKESDDKSRRIRRKHRELAEAGMHPGTWSMMGYRYDFEKKSLHVVAEEAAVVGRIFEMYASGSGLREIAKWLQASGFVGKRGRKRWTNGAVTRILDNPTYAGLRHYDGEYNTLSNAEPVISTELWKEVRQLRLAQTSPAKRREGKGTTLLSGLMFCSCGEPMWRDTYKSRDERSYYVCRRAARKRWGDCRAGGVSARRAERVITQEFLELVHAPYAQWVQGSTKQDLVGDLAPRAQDDVEQKLARLETQMERLIELSLSETGPLAAKKFEQKAQELEREREQLQAQMGERAVAGVAERRRTEDIAALRRRLSDLPRIWGEATGSERNQMLRLAIERVEVTGEGRPKKLKISWADWLQ